MNSFGNKKIELCFESNKEIWDSFVANSPQKNIFVTSKFLDCLDEQYKFLTLKENNVIVAGAVVFEENGVPISFIQPFTQYIGFLLCPPIDLKGHSKLTWEFRITEIFLKALSEKYKTLAFSHSYNFKDLRPFLWFNYDNGKISQFKINLRYTAVLNRTFYENHENYLMKIRTTRRQEYRKAKEKIRIEKSNFSEEILQMYKATIERSTKNNSFLDREMKKLKNILLNCSKNNTGDLYYSIQNEKKIGAIFILKFQDQLYYLIGASTEEGRKVSSNTFLLIEIIKHYFSENYQSFDFLGVNSPNRGDFKLSFGGDLKIFFETKLI